MLEGVGLAALVPILSLMTPQLGGHWRHVVVVALTTFGLTTLLSQLAAVLLAFCIVIAVRAVTLASRDRLLADLSLSFVAQQRLKVISALAHAHWPKLASLEHSRVSHVLSSEIVRLAFACSIMLQMLMAMVMLVVQAALIILLSPAVASFVLGFSMVGLLAIIPLSRRAAMAGNEISRASFSISSNAGQFLGGLKLAIAHDMADSFVDEIAEESAKLRTRLDSQQRFQSRVAIVSASISSFVGAVVVFGAIALHVRTVSLLTTLIILIRMTVPVRTIQTNTQQLFSVIPAFTALNKLYADLGVNTLRLEPTDEPMPAGIIKFEHVDFTYPGAPRAVFSNLNVAIKVGEVVGLTGSSGAGKTTFADLVTGLLVPDAGQLLIGKSALNDRTVSTWRRNLAYVPQDSYLINDNIRRNLTWGRQPLADDDLWRALALAGAADMVGAMPQGLDTVMDERGTRLSGGERQRIALARAVLRSPHLLILDEATNAIDVAAEQNIIFNIRRAYPLMTIIVIAHREESIQRCDRVISFPSRQT